MRTRTPRAASALIALTALASTLSAAPGARAAGLYVADRGVRPLARAGAFVAGADDPGAIAYNPAGLFDAGTQLLVDGSWVNYSSDYTRQQLLRQVDPNTGETVATYVQDFDQVSGSTPFLPIPTLAASLRLNKEWALGFGVWGPYAALLTYPEEVNGQPAPQRYFLHTLEGSVLALVGAGVAYAPMKELRVGATLGMMVGTFNSRVAFSACVPERFVCAPEDPDWDGAAELKAGPIFAPTGQLGATYIPSEKWRLGLSFQLPVWIRTGGTLRARLPATPVFERARQEGEDVDVAMDLPWVLRLGAETRIVKDLRLEVGFGWEHWSMHESIDVDPQGVAIRDMPAFPDPFLVPSVSVPRYFQDAVSVRAGGEYSLAVGDNRLDLRGGLSFETSAVPPRHLTVMTIDAPKVTTALGAGFHVGRFRFDATFAHVFAFDVDVAPEEARMVQVSPVQANPPRNPSYINGGQYSARTNVVGLGVAYTIDTPEER